MRQTLGMADADERPPENVRIGDAERDRVIDVLRAHTAAGRLTLGEFSDRADSVLAARSRSDLDQITADLPDAPPKHGRRRGAGRWVVALLGDSHQRGRWEAAPVTRAVAVMGDVSLDFTTALFGGSDIYINAVALMGDVVVVVPEGMHVEMSGASVLGDKNLRLAPGPTRPGLPRLRIRALAVMGDVTVRT